MDLVLNAVSPLRTHLRRASRPRNRGFTLIEVMIALAILSIALTTVYRLHGQTMELSARARFYNLAPLLAQGKLAEIERLGLAEASDNNGDFGLTYPGYTWTVHIEEMPSDLFKEERYHLVRLDIGIAQGTEENYQLRTYRFYVD